MTVAGLQYIMLGTTDIERSIQFYCRTLSLELLQQFPGFAFLRCGDQTIALSEELGARMNGRPAGVELVLGVSSVRDGYADLRAKGLTFLNEPRAVNGNWWAVNFQDPDGHLLSLYGNP